MFHCTLIEVTQLHNGFLCTWILDSFFFFNFCSIQNSRKIGKQTEHLYKNQRSLLRRYECSWANVQRRVQKTLISNFEMRHSGCVIRITNPMWYVCIYRQNATIFISSHHKHQGLDPLIRSVSRVTAARTIASSVFQMFSFLVVCSGMTSKGFGFVAFFASVKASSVCIHPTCLVFINSMIGYLLH